MNWTKESQIAEETLKILKGILSKSSLMRTESEKRFIVGAVEELNFFRQYINDSTQRREFIEEMSQYMKYVYYPKGTLICNQGDYGVHFGIIARGHAFIYNSKKKSEFEQDYITKRKNPELVELYKKYVEFHGFQKKLKRWLNWNSPGSKRVSVTEESELIPTLQVNMSRNQQALELEKGLKAFVEELLSKDNKVITSSSSTRDLPLEEKLLLLHHNGASKNYFKRGLATCKKVREVQGGDTIAEICLTTDLTVDSTIIASEDIHLFMISREDFRTLVESKIPNLMEKKEFFFRAFPALTIESVIKLCAYVEERVIVNWENVYKEGDEADAIYIVKSGEVQLLTVEKEEKVETYQLPSNIHQKTRKFHAINKFMIGSIESGGVFGEDEVINQTKRKYTAACSSALTCLYIIKKRIFFELFEKYFTYISLELKAALEAKVNWRAKRVEEEKKYAEEGRPQTPPPINQEKFTVKTVRVMDETEAEYRHIKAVRPELVVETKITKKALTVEQRKSRISKNNIEIMVFNNKPDKEKETPKPEAPLQRKNRRNLTLSPEGSLPSHKSSSSVKVQKIKSTLFEQNQDFRRWKKYYEMIFPNSKPQQQNKQGLAISSIPSLKIPSSQANTTPSQSGLMLAKSWGPKDHSQPFPSPKTGITINETLMTENIPSSSILKSPRPVTAFTFKNFENSKTKEFATSPGTTKSLSNILKDQTPKEPTPKETLREQDSVKISPQIANFLKRTVGKQHRRLSIEIDLPKSAGLSTNHPSMATLEEDTTSSYPSLNMLTSKTQTTKSLSNFVRSKMKPKSIVIHPQEPETLITQLPTPFVFHRGQESPRMIIINKVSPKCMQRPLTGYQQKPRMSLGIKNL